MTVAMGQGWLRAEGVIGWVTLAMPSSISQPSTMGSLVLKMQVGRILRMTGNTASAAAACCSSSLACKAW